MFGWFKKEKAQATTALVNGVAVTVEPKEILLSAALRQEVNFPHRCRVGSCTMCKCRLVEGQVKELTDTAYILTDEELDQGMILACQSIPTTDITVEVAVKRRAKQAPAA